jgi:hypothetical protein
MFHLPKQSLKAFLMTYKFRTINKTKTIFYQEL